MKFSVTFTLFIIALGIVINWQTHQQLVFVRECHTELVAKAAQSGVPAEPTPRQDNSRNTKRVRENTKGNGKALAANFIATIIEIDALKRKSGIVDKTLEKKNLDLLASVNSLDSGQIKILISELLLANKDLKESQRDELRHNLIGIVNDHPQATLELFAKSVAIITEYSFGRQIIYTSLSTWAMEDPMASAEWMHKNSDKFPDLIDQTTRSGIINDIAVSHPELTGKAWNEKLFKK